MQRWVLDSSVLHSRHVDPREAPFAMFQHYICKQNSCLAHPQVLVLSRNSLGLSRDALGLMKGGIKVLKAS